MEVINRNIEEIIGFDDSPDPTPLEIIQQSALLISAIEDGDNTRLCDMLIYRGYHPSFPCNDPIKIAISKNNKYAIGLLLWHARFLMTRRIYDKIYRKYSSDEQIMYILQRWNRHKLPE
jgi:hypothetical protein